MAPLADVVWVFIAIAGLFYGGLLLKPLIKASFCAICLAVSLTWFTLFILRAARWFEDDLLLALLLGQSVVGGYYLWESRAPEDWLIFRLPVLLTLTFAAWTIVHMELDYILTAVVALIWLLHIALYKYNSNARVKQHVDKIIACCNRW